MNQAVKFSASDFASDQEIRWCPGCGDYSILAQMKKMLPDLGIAPENMVFVSGIGCSSRFPYYLNTYGLHTIHGRAPAVATGLKLLRDDLSVWVITGDGDGLSIGGNHLLHIIRRNVDVNILLFNNQVYGLTKGQYSPTSPIGQTTKSTPFGSIDQPLNPLSVALAAEASFVARSIDVLPKHLVQTLKRAAEHRGTSFVEIYQNCNVFNDGAFEPLTDRKVRAENLLELEHGQPMLYGAERDKGVVLDGLQLKCVKAGDVAPSDLLVHDETRIDPTYAQILARARYPSFPEPIGVLRAIERPTLEHDMTEQLDQVAAAAGPGTLDELFGEGEVFEVQ